MKNTYSILLILGLLFTSSFYLSAQNGGIVISGQVLENDSQQPVEFATIMIANSADEQVITGTTTAADGTFEIRSNTAKVYLEISFMGFQTKRISDISVNNGVADLGVINLMEDSQTLEEISVRAEKSQTEFRLDKRVFNVGQDLSSTGASALDVLNNVPSVNVNIEGEISLRGSTGVQILINGKPSVLATDEGNALGTITAEMIEKVEVITNPSAKYEAEGTSGIINIVIKKEERKGINGSVSLNTGVPHNHSVGLSLNRRTEKFNLFSQAGVGYRELPRITENINTDLVNGTSIVSDGKEFRNEQFYNIVLGTDYYINDYNVVTLSGSFAYEIEDQPSNTNFSRLDQEGSVVSEWYRTEVTEATNPKWQYELQYKKDFPDNEDHTLLFSALGNFFGKDLNSEFENVWIDGTDQNTFQRTATNFSEARYTFMVDYTHPFSDQFTIETGGQYVINDVSNDYAVSDLINGEWQVNEGFTNIFDYNQKVLGVYGTAAYEGKKFGVKAGLRVENTDLTTFLRNTSEENQQNFTNLFPTLHTSYKLTEKLSVQAGYSRRIRRPRLWDLNPFFNIRNNFSIRTGNPDLLPEFTDSYEVNSIYILDKLSLNFGVYHRYTTEVIERVSVFENNVNTFSPIKVGTNNTTGIEFNAKYTPVKWLTLNSDFNYNYFSRRGTFEATSFDFSASQWSSELTTKVKLPAEIDFEVTGQYQSGVQTIQGEVSGFLFADLGLRKKLMGGRGVVSFSVRDIFASRIRETEILQDDFYLYSFGLRGRFVTLGFSYGFGKGEAMEYTGRRRY